MRSPVLVIANPVSGRGRGARLARAFTERLRTIGCAVDLRETRRAGDALRHASAAPAFAAVVCVGGDGTANEIINGLPPGGAAPPLAMVPCGTANVLAKELALPSDPVRLADLVASGPEVAWDLGVDRRSGRRFALFAGAGFDAQVVHDFHAARTGPIRMAEYVLWGLQGLLHYRPPRLRLALDGRRLEEEVSWALVANVSGYGGPLAFTPRARPDDGLFEVMVIRRRPRRDLVRIFGAAHLGHLLGIDLLAGIASFHRARRVSVEAADGGPVPVQIDGDPGGLLPADLELLPLALRLLVPPGGARLRTSARTGASSCAGSSG